MRPDFLFSSQPARRAPSTLPPAYFSAAKEPRDVRLIRYSHAPSRLSAARKAGVRYETHWHAFANQMWARDYHTFPDEMFAFSDRSGQRCCKPDGVLIPHHASWYAIFEVKVGHISDSYWQLRHLYEPVLSQWGDCRRRTAVVLEVCRRFDPATFYPCETKHLSIVEVDDYLSCAQPMNEVGVLIWKDR